MSGLPQQTYAISLVPVSTYGSSHMYQRPIDVVASGSNGQTLVLNSSSPNGFSWESAPSGTQPLSANLTALSGLTGSARTLFYFTGIGVMATATVDVFKTLLSLIKGDVGLSNVDNTSDINKPVSTATSASIATKEAIITILPVAKGGTATSLVQTEGRIWFSDAAGALTSEAALFWGSVSKRLGINAPATPLADLHVGSGSLAIAGNVAVRIEPVWISNGGLGGYDRAFLFHPTFNYTVGTNAIGMQIIPEIGGGFNIPTLFGVAISPNTTGTVGTYYGIYVYPKTGAGVVTNNHDAAFVGGGCVGINTGSPTAWLHIGAGTATRAPVGLTSGPLLTIPVAGRIEFLTDAYYGTITTGAARKTFAFLEAPVFTGNVTLGSGVTVSKTITAPRTTSVQVINKMAGRVNIAAGESSTAVTNSLVTVDSIIVATCATNDTTARVANVVAGAGAFMITIVACTSETAINWIVLN